MLIPVHLLLLVQMIHLAASSISKEHHHRRHAPKHSPHIHQTYHHKTNRIKPRNIIPLVQSQLGYQGLPILPNKHEQDYPRHYLGKQLYFIQPGAKVDGAAYNSIGKDGEFIWANEDQLEGEELNKVEEDVPARYLEGPRGQRKLPLVEELIAGPNDELKIDNKISPELPSSQGRLPKSDYNLLNSIITKMSPEAQNTLIDVLVRNLEDKTKASSAKMNNIYSKPPLLLLPKQNALQDKPAMPSLQIPTRDEKQVTMNRTGPLVQPFSLTVDKSKIQSLYNILNEGKVKSMPRTNGTISAARNSDSLSQFISEELAKGECVKCLYEATSTVSPKPTTPKINLIRVTHSSHMRYCPAHKPRSMDLESRVVNLTQIFNVHPRLLVVNSNIPNGIGRMTGAKKNLKPPSSKTRSRDESRKPCGKNLEPIYYVDVDQFPSNSETNQEECMSP